MSFWSVLRTQVRVRTKSQKCQKRSSRPSRVLTGSTSNEKNLGAHSITQRLVHPELIDGGRAPFRCLAKIREYEGASTVVANAYIKPTVSRYASLLTCA